MPAPRSQYDIDSLTDGALRVFAERGFEGASMDDVARSARITKAAIYHHVSGKEELLERGRDREFDALVAALVREAQAAGDVDPALDGGLVVRLIFGMCNSLVEWYRPGGALSAAAIVAAVVHVVFDGAGRLEREAQGDPSA